jgi:hypothetical protein
MIKDKKRIINKRLPGLLFIVFLSIRKLYKNLVHQKKMISSAKSAAK